MRLPVGRVPGPGSRRRSSRSSSTWPRSCSQRPPSTSCREAAAGSGTGRSARPRTSPGRCRRPIASSAGLARPVPPRWRNWLLGRCASSTDLVALSDGGIDPEPMVFPQPAPARRSLARAPRHDRMVAWGRLPRRIRAGRQGMRELGGTTAHRGRPHDAEPGHGPPAPADEREGGFGAIDRPRPPTRRDRQRPCPDCRLGCGRHVVTAPLLRRGEPRQTRTGALSGVCRHRLLRRPVRVFGFPLR